MPNEQLLALAILAFVGCFTPGPNNIATVTGANHGFCAALPHVFGVPFGFSSMLIAGAPASRLCCSPIPFIAALLRWARIAVFHCMAARKPAGEGQGLESYWLHAAFVLAVRPLSSTPIRKHGCSLPLQPDRSWRAMPPSPVSQLLLLCFRSLPSAILSLGPGWAPRCELAWHRLANANLQRRDGHAPRRHRNVAGDAVKVMRLLLPAIVEGAHSIVCCSSSVLCPVHAGRHRARNCGGLWHA